MFPGTPPGLPNTILGVSWWSGKRPRKKILVPTRKRPRPPAWRPRPFAFRSSGAGQGGAEPHRSGEAASRNRSRISTRSGAARKRSPADGAGQGFEPQQGHSQDTVRGLTGSWRVGQGNRSGRCPNASRPAAWARAVQPCGAWLAHASAIREIAARSRGGPWHAGGAEVTLYISLFLKAT